MRELFLFFCAFVSTMGVALDIHKREPPPNDDDAVEVAAHSLWQKRGQSTSVESAGQFLRTFLSALEWETPPGPPIPNVTFNGSVYLIGNGPMSADDHAEIKLASP